MFLSSWPKLYNRVSLVQVCQEQNQNQNQSQNNCKWRPSNNFAACPLLESPRASASGAAAAADAAASKKRIPARCRELNSIVLHHHSPEANLPQCQDVDVSNCLLHCRLPLTTKLEAQEDGKMTKSKFIGFSFPFLFPSSAPSLTHLLLGSHLPLSHHHHHCQHLKVLQTLNKLVIFNNFIHIRACSGPTTRQRGRFVNSNTLALSNLY